MEKGGLGWADITRRPEENKTRKTRINFKMEISGRKTYFINARRGKSGHENVTLKMDTQSGHTKVAPNLTHKVDVQTGKPTKSKWTPKVGTRVGTQM